MLLLAAALTAAMATPAVAAPDRLRPMSSARANCPRTSNYEAWHHGAPLQPHKLTELPPANGYSAVWRRIGGCEAPIVVKYGVGNR